MNKKRRNGVEILGKPRPIFSIITVTKNAENTIADCVESIRRQTFGDLEHLIIDGKSTDSTIQILKKLNNEKMSYISESDAGLYDAMNKGIQMSKGQYVGILNADDKYSEDCLKLVINAFQKFPDVGIVYGGMIIDQNDKLFVSHLDLESKMICHPTCFVSREVYEKIGSFNLKYQVAADYDFMLRAKTSGVKFIGIESEIVEFRSGGFSSKNPFKSIFETYQIHLKYAKKSIFRSSILFWKSLLKHLIVMHR
jgi:glycosyltransferase involved in cell wall biosynthesis